MKKVKRKLKKKFKISLYLILILVIVIIGKCSFNKKDNNIKTNNNDNLKQKINYNEYITEKSENNTDMIKEFLSEGMKVNTFKNVLSYQSKYIEKNKKENNYNKIEYNFEKHLSYEELEEIYIDLNKSKIVNIEIIGTTYDNRDLYSIEIGTGKDIIMFEGNIHAAEIAPTLFLTKFAVDLVNEWESSNKEIKELLSSHKILILPSANPDGYNYSLFGKETIKNKDSFVYQNDNDIEEDYYKANLNGVDLNRNFPSQTGGLLYAGNILSSSTSRVKSTERLAYFPGTSLGSEKETQAIIYWMYKNYKSAYAYVALHSAGRVIYNGKPHLSEEFNTKSSLCANLVNSFTGYTVLDANYEDVGYGADGTSTDMIAEIANGFKFSEKTGRLSYDAYKSIPKKVEKNICVLTIETMERYTQNLETIKNEFYNKEIYNMLLALASEIDSKA